MLDKVIHFSIHNKLIIGILTLFLIAWGGYSLTQLPIDAVPDITNNQVQVITVSPSLSAQEIERLVTFPVEISMANIPHLTEIRSMSRFGLSVVTIVFTENTDIYWARQQVSERLQQATAQIPAGAGLPELAPVSTGLGEIYQYTIFAKKGYEAKYPAMELRTIQDWIVRRQLLGTQGVADISSFGGYVKQYEIAINPDKLRALNIAVADIFTALEKNNQNTGSAYIDRKPNAYFIRSEGLIKSLDDIAMVVIRHNDNGTPILIRDVATVQFGHAVRYGAMTRNEDGEVVGGIVLMLKGENSSKVIKNVKERVEQIRKTLPEGLEIEAFLDRTKLVNSAIKTVSTNLIEGALIVVFVLVLLLGNWRAGLVVASVIPLAMLFAISLMNLFGVSGNLMSLGAIDFGLIVDGAVIIVEATLHHLKAPQPPKGEFDGMGVVPPSGARGLEFRGLTQSEMDSEVYHSAVKIRSSAAFGEIIILIVYLPLLALSGIEGKMFKPMAQTVSFAILGAFILSLTYVPMMSALCLSKKISYKKNIADHIIAFFNKLYNPVIRWALHRKILVIATTLVFFAISLGVFFRMGGEFIPSLDEGDFAVETRLMTGSSLAETIEITSKASKILRDKFPEVRETIGKIGSSEIPTDPMPLEACDLMVLVKDKSEWTSASTKEELVEKMSAELENLVGVEFGFQHPIQMRFNELMTGVRQDVAIKIYGEDLKVLVEQGDKIAKQIQNIEGVKDIYTEKIDGFPQIVVSFQRERLAQFGVNITDVNQVLSTAFAGTSAGLVYEGEKRFDMVIRLEENSRQNIVDVRNLFVLNDMKEQIPITQVADIEFKIGANQIQRDDTKRRITVAFNVRGRDVESIVGEIQQKLEGKIKLPAGYYISYGGQFKNLQEAKQRLSIAVPIALALIFVLLFFTFGSVKQSLLIFSAIPLSAIGGIFALWLRDMPFSISAGVGFIALFGVAVLNGIVLIGEFNYLKKSGLTDIDEIIFEGTHTRLRPVLMTALVASLGFLPMALSNGSGAEVQKPLATVVIGGLVSATLLTLLVLPCLYVYVEKGFGKTKIAIPNNIATILLIIISLFAFIPQNSTAQTPTQNNVIAPIKIQTLTLKDAIALALQNNGSIKIATQQIDYQKTIKGSATDIGKTNVGFLYGQYNSFLNDNNVSISQSLPFPILLAKQIKLAEANIKNSELQKNITQNELVQQVKSVYFKGLFLVERQKLLYYQDSIFSNFLRATELRYKTGEGNELEKTVAQSQSLEAKNLLAQNASDIKIMQTELQTLLNTKEKIELAESLVLRKLPNSFLQITDSTTTEQIAQNPFLALLKQQIAQNEAVVAVEKAKLLPDINLGFTSQTLAGYQRGENSPEVYYDLSKRFSVISVGLSFSLWAKPQKARIKAAKIQTSLAQNQYQHAERNLEGQYQNLIQLYLKHENTIKYYENSALTTADAILRNAEKSFRSGNIGYVEYFQGLKQALAIKTAHQDVINQYNQTVIAIEFLVGME